jgi:hypothetical protein
MVRSVQRAIRGDRDSRYEGLETGDSHDRIYLISDLLLLAHSGIYPYILSDYLCVIMKWI